MSNVRKEIYYYPRTHACVLAKQGFFVFICDTQKKPYAPIAPNGYLSATNDVQTINSWRMPDEVTVAIACKQSQLIVFDCDVKNGIDGVTAFHEFAQQSAIDLSISPCVRTPSGGLHYYFRLPDGFFHGNGTGALPKGIDVRCAGYVIAPGSMLPNNKSYDLVQGSLSHIPILPAALQAAITTTRNEPTSTEPRLPQPVPSIPAINQPFSERESAYAREALEAEVRILAAAPKGSRNIQLFKSTAALFNCVASGWLTHEIVESAIWRACVANGLIADDGATTFNKTFQSGMTQGLSTPRPPLKESDNSRQPATISKAKVFWDGDALPETLRQELVKGLLPRTGVGFIAGQSGAGKTFVALALAACAATGLPFFGHKIRENVGTLFLLGEGLATIDERLAALKKGEFFASLELKPTNLPISWRAFDAPFPHENEKQAIMREIEEVQATMRTRHGVRLGLIIIDTLAAAFALDDENDAGAATQTMQFLQKLAIDTNALVIAVAHQGKNADSGVRGSSAYTASADAILSVIADASRAGEVKSRSISLTKSRTRETGWKCGFVLHPISLGIDEDGDTIWSCHVSINASDNTSDVRQEKKTSLGRSILFDAFDRLLVSRGEPVRTADAPNSVIATRHEFLRQEFYTHYPADSDDEKKRNDATRKQFSRVFESALKDGLLRYQFINNEGWVWRA